MGAIAPWHQRKNGGGNGGNSEAKPTRLASFATSTTLPVAEQALAWLQEQDVLTPGLHRKIRDAVSQSRKSGRDLIAQGLYDRIKRELTESVEGGESATEWRDRVKDIGGVTQSQVETIGRTYSHRAYHEGMKTIMDDPVVADEFPYLQYFATQDTRTRPTHLAMDGKVAHKDSPMAAQMQALLAEWNCRCGSAPLSREDALAEGIDDDTGWVEPDAEAVDEAELPTAGEPDSFPVVEPPQPPRITTQRIDELISELAPKPPTPTRAPTSSTPAELIPAKPASALIPVVKSKAKVEAKKADLQAFVDLIKKPADKSALANIVGATDKAKVTAEYRPNFNELKIYVREKRYYADRQLHRDLNGNLVMENQIFEIKNKADQGKGLGAEIFANQVASARQLGVTKIKTLATRGPGLNGYYTWARLGYDARLPDIIRSQLPPQLRGAIRLSDLMTTEAGRDWWRANGVTLHMEFDLADDSISHRVLADYLEERKQRKGSMALAADVDVGLNVDEQIPGVSGAANQVEQADELSDEDEAALDRAWAKERARRDKANRLVVE